MGKLLVIHHNDLDGFGSAWLYKIARYKLAGGEFLIRDVTVSYPSRIADVPVKGYDVVIIDLQCPEDQYERILKEADSLMVIDHHPESVALAQKYPKNNILAVPRFAKYIENGVCTCSAAKLVHLWLWYEVWDRDEDEDISKELVKCEFAVGALAEAISIQDLGNTPKFDYAEANNLDDIEDQVNALGNVSDYAYCGYLMNLICGTFHKKQSLYERLMLDMYNKLETEGNNPLVCLLKMDKYREIIDQALHKLITNYWRLMRAREVRIKLGNGDYFRVKCALEITSLLPISTSYFANDPNPADIIAVKKVDEYGNITFSIRSGPNSKISARQFASVYGGGGHEFASGIGNFETAAKLSEDLLYPKATIDLEIPEFLNI